MKAQLSQLETLHRSAQAPLNLADVIEEVSKHAANPVETALVIDHMLRRRKIRFSEHFDERRLSRM